MELVPTNGREDEFGGWCGPGVLAVVVRIMICGVEIVVQVSVVRGVRCNRWNVEWWKRAREATDTRDAGW